MRARGWVVTACLAGALAAGCGGEPDEAPGGDATPSPGDTASAIPDDRPDGPVRVTGFFLVGPDRRDFEPCSGGGEYWVDGPALPDLMELHRVQAPGTEPFESIFVDVVARHEAPPASGSGATLDGTLFVTEVRRAAFESFGCREAPQDLVVSAGGNEPFWNVRITTAEGEFSSPDETFALQPGPLEPAPEGWAVEGTTAAGEAFTLTLGIGGCSDSMSGAYSHLTARLALPGRTLEGCAFLGPAGEP